MMRRSCAATADIARGDIVIATMLFLDDHVRAVMPALDGPPQPVRCHDLLHVISPKSSS